MSLVVQVNQCDWVKSLGYLGFRVSNSLAVNELSLHDNQDAVVIFINTVFKILNVIPGIVKTVLLIWPNASKF